MNSTSGAEEMHSMKLDLRHRVVDGAQVGCALPVRVGGKGKNQNIPKVVSLCVLGVTLCVFAVK
jgi:hypothetical protein